MGGAVMLSAEAAFHAGAGKVTVVCDAKHHTAILSRAPNIMLRDINQMSLQEREALVAHVDAVSLHGLGRNSWAQSSSLMHGFHSFKPVLYRWYWMRMFYGFVKTEVKLGEQVYAAPRESRRTATLLRYSAPRSGPSRP